MLVVPGRSKVGQKMIQQDRSMRVSSEMHKIIVLPILTIKSLEAMKEALGDQQLLRNNIMGQLQKVFLFPVCWCQCHKAELGQTLLIRSLEATKEALEDQQTLTDSVEHLSKMK
jgi:hypothetical protein